MNKTKLMPFLSLIVLGLISACGSAALASNAAPMETSLPPTAEQISFPTGRFVSVNNSIYEYEFRPDNTWSYYEGGLMSAKGTYQVNDDLWIEDGTTECPFSGTYRWSYDGKALSFKLQGEDRCDPRREATDGQSFTFVK
jgi:hypothetical protein